MLFKVEYSGFAIVEAESEDSAMYDFDPNDALYSEQSVDSVEEVHDW